MGDEFTKLLHGVLPGRIVNSVDERQPFPFNEASHCFVGGDHEFFDDLMSQISLRPDNVFCLSLKIEDDLRFGKIEIEGSSPHSLLSKVLGKGGHAFQGGQEMKI